MPNKNNITDRERKKNNNNSKHIYSSKHIRLRENYINTNSNVNSNVNANVNNNKKNKKIE